MKNRKNSKKSQNLPEKSHLDVGFFLSYVLPFFVLPGLILCIYVPSSDAPFVFDSIPEIELNEKLDTAYFKTNLLSNSRGLVYFSFAIEKLIYGNWSIGYSLTNIAIHIINGLLIFLVVKQTIVLVKENTFSESDIGIIGGFSALIWAVHPLQTNAVIYHVQRLESLMTLFFLLAIYSLSKFLESDRWIWLIAAAASSFLSMRCKEVGYMSPIVLFTYYYVFGSSERQKFSNKSSWIYGLGIVVALAVMFVAYRFWLGNPAAGEDKMSKSIAYLAAQTHIIPYYIWLTIFPGSQNIDYGWPYLSSIYQAILPGSILAAAFVFAVIQTYQRKPQGWFLISFFLVLAPTSSVIPITDLAFEHRMYLASLMLIVPLVVVIFSLAKSFGTNQFFVFGSIVLLFTIMSFSRCQVWRTKIELWNDSVSKAPLNPRPHNNLAIALAQDGRWKLSIRSFERALQLIREPELKIETEEMVNEKDVLSRLGSVCLFDKNYKKANRYLLQWMEKDEGFYYEYLDFAVSFAESGHSKTAEPFFKKAAMTAGNKHEKAFVLGEHGLVLLNTGQAKLARELLQQSVDLDPKRWKSRNNLGIAIMNTDQDKQKAKEHFAAAVELSERNPEAVANYQRIKHQH